MGGSSAHDLEYSLFVIPEAEQGFVHTSGSTMVFWRGDELTNPHLIDKPVLVVEGIDADNTNFHETYYALGLALFETGRSRGADVIILNFANGGQDLRANAAVLEDAIEYINRIRYGYKKLVVAGVSMGGVIARYALAGMEQNGTPHGASHFVSIDAPQQGAVVDDELQDFIKNPPFGADPPVPANLTSTAGKQLLTYAAFDSSNPSLHDQFFDELNALNGDGYPHLTDNVGVAFSTDDPNPFTGSQWMRIRMPVHPDERLYIQRDAPEAKAGSYLPLEATAFFGRALWGLFGWELDRSADPTFIPHASALDIVSGESKFDGDPIVPLVESTYHDRFDTDLVEPILTRIGFPEPPPEPLNVSISGPSSVAGGETGTWTANRSGGSAPYAYLWEYEYPCPDPDPCPPGKICAVPDGDITIQAPQCGAWSPTGTSASLTRSFSSSFGSVRLRVRVTDDEDTVRTAQRTISVSSGRPAGDDLAQAASERDGGARSADDQSAAARGAAVSGAALLSEPALRGAIPNPFHGEAEIAFALPEASEVRLVVFDLLGREVARPVEGRVEAGHHRVRFDGHGLPAGVYVVRMAAGEYVSTVRMTLVR